MPLQKGKKPRTPSTQPAAKVTIWHCAFSRHHVAPYPLICCLVHAWAQIILYRSLKCCIRRYSSTTLPWTGKIMSINCRMNATQASKILIWNCFILFKSMSGAKTRIRGTHAPTILEWNKLISFFGFVRISLYKQTTSTHTHVWQERFWR